MRAIRIATASIFLIAAFISPILATGDMDGCPDDLWKHIIRGD